MHTIIFTIPVADVHLYDDHVSFDEVKDKDFVLLIYPFNDDYCIVATQKDKQYEITLDRDVYTIDSLTTLTKMTEIYSENESIEDVRIYLTNNK